MLHFHLLNPQNLKSRDTRLGLDWQKINFARASRFSVHFLAVVARLQHETSYFILFYGVGEHNTKSFFFFS